MLQQFTDSLIPSAKQSGKFGQQSWAQWCPNQVTVTWYIQPTYTCITNIWIYNFVTNHTLQMIVEGWYLGCFTHFVTDISLQVFDMAILSIKIMWSINKLRNLIGNVTSCVRKLPKIRLFSPWGVAIWRGH